MKGVNFYIGIDSLKFGYKTDDKIRFQELINLLEIEGVPYFEGFRMTKINNPNHELSFRVDINLIDKWYEYGVLLINGKFDKSVVNGDADEEQENEESGSYMIWFEFLNPCLYNDKISSEEMFSYLDYITSYLELKIYSITKLDIYIDSNINTAKRFKSAIRNLDLELILLNKKILDRKKTLVGISFLHTSNRIKYNSPTCYINTHDKDISLCLYDKTVEVKTNQKQYILEAHNSGKNNIYRTELRLKWKPMKEFLIKNNITLYDCYLKLEDKSFLFDLFEYFSNRLVRFKKDRLTINILEL